MCIYCRPSKSTRRNMGSAFNQTASDFLHDIGRVFPDNQTVAKASALVSAAVSMDENTFVPALVFMDGKPESEWKTMERQMFQIPLPQMEALAGGMTPENRAIMQRYVDNMSTILTRTLAQRDELNKAIGDLKQGGLMEKLQGVISNPQTAMSLLQDPAALGGLGEALLSNPEAGAMMEQMKPMLTMALGNLVPNLEEGALNNLSVPRQ